MILQKRGGAEFNGFLERLLESKKVWFNFAAVYAMFPSAIVGCLHGRDYPSTTQESGTPRENLSTRSLRILCCSALTSKNCIPTLNPSVRSCE
jgi:hypothetical protein